jgi:hypothetical protein
MCGCADVQMCKCGDSSFLLVIPPAGGILRSNLRCLQNVRDLLACHSTVRWNLKIELKVFAKRKGSFGLSFHRQVES